MRWLLCSGIYQEASECNSYATAALDRRAADRLKMIRRGRIPQAPLDAWLVHHPVLVNGTRYRLRVWRDNPAAFDGVSKELRSYIEEAHADARRRLRDAFEDDLSPFNDPAVDPAANYPALLHRVTLQGYFGELLGILAVEHWGAHGETDWLAPALLFRFHDCEFQHLDIINQRLAAGDIYDPDRQQEKRPGRTGDDGLAFRRDAHNRITDVLTLESKCLSRHKTEKIRDAHEKLSTAARRPPSVREIIEVLRQHNDLDSKIWVEALLSLWRDRCANACRHDGVVYACGEHPKDTKRIGWMDADAPHRAYSVERSLEGMEFHFQNLNATIDHLYRSR